jgi:hypothetical protein
MHNGMCNRQLGVHTTTFEYPKSQIFTSGACLPASSTFSSFRSRWHTPCRVSAQLSPLRSFI